MHLNNSKLGDNFINMRRLLLLNKLFKKVPTMSICLIISLKKYKIVKNIWNNFCLTVREKISLKSILQI